MFVSVSERGKRSINRKLYCSNRTITSGPTRLTGAARLQYKVSLPQLPAYSSKKKKGPSNEEGTEITSGWFKESPEAHPEI